MFLDGIGYSRPVCLSCDDRKLTPVLQTYYDAKTKVWHLVGGTGGPILIADNEELLKVLQNNKVEKVSKVWLIAVFIKVCVMCFFLSK